MNIFEFDYMTLIFNPFVLMFVTIALGILLGKVNLGRFSLGSSGALFVGLVIGWAVYKYASAIYISGDEAASGYLAASKIMESNGGKVINPYFFSASLIFFVAAVGLLASKDLGAVIKKYGSKFILLGFLITFVGAGATYGATALISSTNSYAISGVYTGALTSSPGLAAALETSAKHAESMALNYEDLSIEEKDAVIEIINLSEHTDLQAENVKTLNKSMVDAYTANACGQVGMGYAVGYPFGVIIVILGVNFLSVIFKFNIDEEKKKYKLEMDSAQSSLTFKNIPVTNFSILSFSIVCLTGYMLGNLNIYMGPLGYVCLESTGGVLIASLVFGYIGKIGPLSFRMEPRTLSAIRELGLVFFLAIVGLNYGYGAITALSGSGLTIALIATIVGLLSILSGFFVGRYVLKLNWVALSGALCGGMTSTPGLGAATDALGSDDPGAGYGATYPFALMGMIIFTIIMFKLPAL